VGHQVSAAGVFAPTDPTGQTVYALDVTRGIEVLRNDRKRSGREVEAQVRRSWVRRGNVGASRTDSVFSSKRRYGWVYRTAARRAL
jgi:hypothetical protein